MPHWARITDPGMANGLLRSMLSFILTDFTFTGVSERSKISTADTKSYQKSV
jgi:hypothetical protein